MYIRKGIDFSTDFLKKMTPKCIFFLKNLHISEKSSNFAADSVKHFTVKHFTETKNIGYGMVW